MTTRRRRAIEVLAKISHEGPAHAREYSAGIPHEAGAWQTPRREDAVYAIRASLRSGALVAMRNRDGSVWLHRPEWLRDYPDQYRRRERLAPGDARIFSRATQSDLRSIVDAEVDWVNGHGSRGALAGRSVNAQRDV